MAMLVYHKLTIGFMAMSTYDLGSPWIQYLISQRSTAVLEKKNIHGDSANLPIGGVHGISIEWEFITSDEDRIYRTRVTVQGGWLTPHGNKHTHTSYSSDPQDSTVKNVIPTLITKSIDHEII